ncbi:MAG: Mitochondrial beta-keto-acyl synthase [Chaenotheca gracillima]|nr:MAG: Mitochondrial beta-keto-acyl synthase [Chaenotheca gracillima]
MASSSNKSDHLHLNYLPQLSATQPRSGSSTANTSPIDQPSGSGVRSPFGNPNGLGNTMPSNTRLGAGSPSHELGGGSRLFAKRAREIQAQERVGPSVWGPPTSGNSTPLRENIPESPTDGFPDFKPMPSETNTSSSSSARRVRAGTLPSRFSPGGVLGGSSSAPQSRLPQTSRPTPTGSPFKADLAEAESNMSQPANTNAALLSRLRSGSMPQRNSYLGGTQAGPFGPTLFSTNWASGRDRSATLASLNSSNAPSSPAQSSFSKDGVGDNEMRTLDYLGLADTPQSQRSMNKTSLEALMENQRAVAMQPFMADVAGLNKSLNRFRSYSVNAKEKYAEEEDEDMGHHAPYSSQHSGSMTPSAASAAAALAATQAQIHQHNLAVQAFTNQASANRPRARTAGVLESPPNRTMRNYLATPSRLDNTITAADIRLGDPGDYAGLPEAIQAMHLSNGLGGRYPTDAGLGLGEGNLEGPTRALWLGSIPSSTTVTSLNAIFNVYGKIESARVLTHKNCGFVNFELAESAVQAKNLLNGKEIFPGAGPVRIGFAKVPDGSQNGTPGHGGAYPSPSPDPFTKGNSHSNEAATNSANLNGYSETNGGSSGAGPSLTIPELPQARDDILAVVLEFGATDEDRVRITKSIEQAIEQDEFEAEIPAIPEPSHNRIHDAPKLREIRKRIDNNSCSKAEIEDIAMGMLSEISELASDYLGNTVVQKLFEHCSEPIKESMLHEIVPHMAEIGVHKNGTWAAQKIIDVAKTPSQQAMIVESLRRYTVPLFLDQYGNYVLQCCLRFGFPYNNFIFEAMISRMWEIAQGRFGARAMRACLESHHSTRDQQRMLAAAIAMHSVQLATNANGALLLTWFLDTCTFPRRRTVLAPRLVPHLVHLCTHKVAYLTVLKVINQRNEAEARDVILRALFFSPNDQVLEEILGDSGCGATLIFKVLTTPFFEESMRSEVVQNIRNVLTRLKAQPQQGYKRLMDEVGLSTRNGMSGSGSNKDSHSNRDGSSRPPTSQERNRSTSQHRPGSAHTPQPPMERQYSGNFFPGAPQLSYDPNTGIPRSNGIDPNGMSAFDQFGLNGVNAPMFQPGTGLPISPISPQQLQYQQALLAASARSMAPASFYPGMSPGVGLGNFPGASPSMDSYRNGAQGQVIPPMSPPGGTQMSPNSLLGQTSFPQPTFNPLMGGPMMTGGFQYPTMNGMQFVPAQQQPQQQPQPGGNRRGRVR